MNMFRTTLLALLLILPSAAALSQHQHPHAASPYAGLEKRTVKALSDQQVADLRAGRGMGYALAAELNGYPGPSHVLELLIAQEIELDRQFSGRTVTTAGLTEITSVIAGTQAALRAAHLRYHIATTAVLTPEQVRQYGELRGYSRAE